jgi:hypothetical protein
MLLAGVQRREAGWREMSYRSSHIRNRAPPSHVTLDSRSGGRMRACSALQSQPMSATTLAYRIIDGL